MRPVSAPLSRASAMLRGAAIVMAVAIAAGCAQQARKPAPQPGIVSVTYIAPAGFSDTRHGPPETDKARRAWLDALALHLSERAAAALPEGQRLAVRLNDVQRAGGFEPWRGPQAGDVRIVRDIYPPRIDLEFKLLAADCSVLRTDRRELRDTGFLIRTDMYPGDPLRFEKTLLDDWVRREWGGR